MASGNTILVFAPRFPPRRGGSATYFSNIVESLSNRYDFIVLTFYHPDEDLVDRSDGYLVFRVIPFVDMFPAVVRGLIESMVSFLTSMYLHLTTDIDVVHLHAGSFASPGIAAASSLWRTPIIYDCRDEMFPPWLVKFGITPLWFSCASNVDSILLNNGIPEERIVRAPVSNPKYVGRYAKDDPGLRSGDGFKIIFVGMLIKEKGVPLLLDGFEAFASEYPDARLQLVGRDTTEDIERAIERRNLCEQVTWAGEVPHEEAIRRIAESDVLVLPSRDEALPRAIIEAFEIGVPVIATPVGEIPNVVRDHETGILIEHTPESLRSALEELYMNESLRQEIATNAQEKSREWDWENLTEQLSDAYDKVIGRKSI